MVTLTKADGENFSTYSGLGEAEARLQLTMDGSAFQCLEQPIMKREESIPLLPVDPCPGKSEKNVTGLAPDAPTTAHPL